MADLPGLTLTPHLDPSSDPQVRDEAVRLLQGYYAGLLGTGKGFEGGWWDGFDPSRTRGASPDVFTVDDLLSASLLSASRSRRWAARMRPCSVPAACLRED